MKRKESMMTEREISEFAIEYNVEIKLLFDNLGNMTIYMRRGDYKYRHMINRDDVIDNNLLYDVLKNGVSEINKMEERKLGPFL